MKRTPPSVATRALLATLLLAVATLGITSPAVAGAYATVAPAPLYPAPSGLPDGRVYEQVSPADKNGNSAGASTNLQTEGYGGLAHYALAAADGDSVLFEGSGAIGETAAGYSLYFVAQRSAGGWSTHAILPRAQQSSAELGGELEVQPALVDPSADLTHVMFVAHKGTYGPPPWAQCGTEYGKGEDQLYLSGPAPALATTWLTRPEASNPIERCGPGGEAGYPVGGTPDFSTVYFAFPGTLLPEDAARAPHVEGGFEGHARQEAWGFYEDSEGVLREAGVLPDGSLDPFGAVPAGSGSGRAPTGTVGRAPIGNQVSADGSRAFFVSPDPASCAGANNCAVDPPELYVRENGEKTLLVSKDTLLPEGGGLPASAPHGVSPMINPVLLVIPASESSKMYVFASPDGSQAFFQSEDKLTADAPEGPPGNVTPKTYDFDVETGALTYLPNVEGEIVATDADGSVFAFVRPEAGGAPAELDLWSTGPGGGSVTPITQLIGTPPNERGGTRQAVPVARMSSDGSAVVFTSPVQVPGAFNSGTGFEQIYRYEASTNKLSCVSCAPAGVTPTGSAELSVLQANEQVQNNKGNATYTGMVNERGISADGARIFFDTPTRLVAQATSGVRNVYEWEQAGEGSCPAGREGGCIYLISTGRSAESSYFLDNSESGEDVFFATAEGLVPGDTDGGYDVYDARVPRPGDNPPPAAVPCEGSVCQGPPRVPSPFGAPASATFSGPGNLAPDSAAATQVAKPKPKPKAKRCKKGFVKKKGKCVKKHKAKRQSKRSKRGKS